MSDPKPLDYTATLSTAPSPVLNEQGIEEAFIQRLEHLKYQYRPDIRDRAALEANFREKFEALNRVRLTDAEFARLLDEIITPDVFTASPPRGRSSDGFLKKCDLGRTISRYMVLIASEQKLLVMRPYKVYAVQHMVTCIDEDNGNGFIWHTTGSGKTLTSFKAATLLKENVHIHKCVFVVDRNQLQLSTLAA